MKKPLVVIVLLACVALGAGLGYVPGRGSPSSVTAGGASPTLPTATEMSSASDTPAATATEPPPTATTAPSETPQPTATSEATATETAEPAPVDTGMPMPTIPKAVMVTPSSPTLTATSTLPTATAAALAGLHGVAGRLRTRAGRSDYAAGEEIALALEAENRTDQDITFGLLEINDGHGRPLQASESGGTIGAHSVLAADGRIRFAEPGTYTVTLAICFSPTGSCRSAGADWEEFTPGLVLNIK